MAIQRIKAQLLRVNALGQRRKELDVKIEQRIRVDAVIYTN
jgi:hypothetical protein